MLLVYFKLISPVQSTANNDRFKSSQAFRLHTSGLLEDMQCSKHKNIDSEVTIYYKAVENNFEITEVRVEPCCETFEEQILARLGFDLYGNKIY